MPEIANPEGVKSMKVWHCKFKSLEEISRCANLEELVIATYPDETFELLSGLKHLRYLSVLHMPNLSDVTPLSSLVGLESLSLSTAPSWDAKRQITEIGSLIPISKLKNLKHLELFGICPKDRSLVALEKMSNLQTARFSQYPKQEVERFYSATGVQNCFNPEPSFGG